MQEIQGTERLNAVHAGHPVVEKKDGIGLLFPIGRRNRFQCFFAGVDKIRAETEASENRRENKTRVLLVVGNEHALSRQTRKIGWQRRRRGGTLERNGDKKNAALSDGTLDANRTAHQFGQPLGDRQSQPGAPVISRRRICRLFEFRKETLDLFVRDPDAGVAYGEGENDATLILLCNPRRQIDSSGVGELDRIAHEVQKDLPEPIPVAAQERGNVVEIDRDRKVLSRRVFLDQIADLVDDLGRLEVIRVQRDLPGFNLGQIEDVVDDLQKVCRRFGELIQFVRLARRQGVLTK